MKVIKTIELREEQIENSFGTYIRGKPNTVPNPVIIQQVDLYRKHITQRFVTRREQDIPTLYGKKFIASEEYDCAFYGYCYNEFTHDSFFFNVPAHRVFMGLPVCEELTNILKAHSIKTALLVGELIASPRDPIDFEGRSRIYYLIKYRRNPQSQEDLGRIGFRVFDILELDGEKWLEKDFKERFQKLKELFSEGGQIGMVKTKVFKNPYDIQDFYKKYVIQGGHEGIIVRVGNVAYKIKPIHVLDVAIIGVAAGREGTKLTEDQLASCLVALRYPDGNYQILTRVGTGLTDHERAELWTKFTYVESKGFVYNTTDGRAYNMVKPRLVGQIEYMDILTDSGGEPIYQPSLKFDDNSNSWEPVRPMPFVKLIAPRFLESEPIREDKNAFNIVDVRIKQLLDVVDIPRVERISRVEFSPSEIIARKIYVKKGAVRKFIVWKTNKENTGNYPRFVIYHLDYSKNRKQPLSRKVKIGNNEDQMWKMYEELITSEIIGSKGNLKRGWTEYSSMDIRGKKLT